MDKLSFFLFCREVSDTHHHQLRNRTGIIYRENQWIWICKCVKMNQTTCAGLNTRAGWFIQRSISAAFNRQTTTQMFLRLRKTPLVLDDNCSHVAPRLRISEGPALVLSRPAITQSSAVQNNSSFDSDVEEDVEQDPKTLRLITETPQRSSLPWCKCYIS